MHQLCLFLHASFKADGSASGLIILKVGAGGDLHIPTVRRHPDLNVVGLGGGEAQIAGGETDHTVRQTQHLQNTLRVVGQGLQLVVGGLRIGKLDQLHFIELVLTDQTPGIATRGACLRTEAGGIGTEFHRQLTAFQNIAPVNIGDGHFRCGNQEVIFIGNLCRQTESVFLKFGQLTGTDHGSAVDHKRRENLGVAVFGVGVQIEIDDGALQRGAEALVEMEAGAGDLGGRFRIQNIQSLADVPVGFRLKREFFWLSPAADLHIVAVIVAYRHTLVGHIGDGEQNLLLLVFQFTELAVADLDLLGNHLHPFHDLGDVSAFFFDLRNLLGLGILLRLLGLHLADDLPALHVDSKYFVHQSVRVKVAGLHSCFDPVWILSYDFDV